MGKLTPQEMSVLRFEGQHWPNAARKEEMMGTLLGFGAVTYYQVLNGLLDREEALADSPVLVNRLRAVRDSTRRPSS